MNFIQKNRPRLNSLANAYLQQARLLKQRGGRVRFLWWDGTLGKGIDDVIRPFLSKREILVAKVFSKLDTRLIIDESTVPE